MNNTNPQVFTYEPATNNSRENSWVILCDFDGTISLADVTDTLLTNFGMQGHEELESAWEQGIIGSRECMGGQIALLDMNKAELDAALDRIEVDPSFKSFIFTAHQLGIQIKIVSDGLDYAIKRILNNNGLVDLPIYANRLIQLSERRWQLEFPYSNRTCIKSSGNCKCARVAFYHSGGEQVLFVGDGSSDFCASGKANFVLAKASLIHYCQQQNIPYLAINNFSQAVNFLNNDFSTIAITV